MTARTVEWRISSRRWRQVRPGVYLTDPGRTGWAVEAMAAFLGVGEPVAFAGECAAWFWSMGRAQPRSIELVVPATRRVAAPVGATVRRSTRWDGLVDELAWPWRTIRPATVLHLAGRGDADEAVAVVARAVQQEWVTAAMLLQELRRPGRHPFGRLLGEVLADVADGAHSAAEVRYVRDVERAHGLPEGERQGAADRGGRTYSDTTYREQRVVVEVDGRLGHEGWSGQVRDGRRDRRAAADGWLTTRLFWPDVASTPCVTAVEIGQILAGRGWSARPRRCRRRLCSV